MRIAKSIGTNEIFKNKRRTTNGGGEITGNIAWLINTTDHRN